jgi:hypothetical protein
MPLTNQDEIHNDMLLNRRIAVPEDMINAGRPTNVPRDESPETLDAALERDKPKTERLPRLSQVSEDDA